MDILQDTSNISEYPLNTTNTFIIDVTLESELKKLLENKNKIKDIKLDKISFLSKNIQSIGNEIPLIFCNITRLYLSNNNITNLEGIEQFANLTHLSISYNLIEDIYELNRIINPEILLFLNVKGNFFCKNPSTTEVILNLFLNLKSLDDLKINNSHKKLIKYGQDLNKLILPFILDIEEKLDKISTIQNVFQLNQEYNLINSSNNSLQNKNNENLNLLIDELNNIDENCVSKILSLINEKKVLNNNNNVNPPINELNNLINNYLINSSNNLINSEENKIKSIYENLFLNLILNQKRKDYKGFLNYLIMNSEPKLLEFIRNKGNCLNNIEMNKTSINIICQNFEKILINNSDYTMQNINEVQMMIFYMYFNGNNILTNNENDVEIITDEKGKEKIILNNYEKKLFNFREIIPDYFPIFPLDNEFMKNLMNFIKEKLNLLLKNASVIKQMKINQNIENSNVNKDEINNINNNQNNEGEQLYYESNQNINDNQKDNIEEDDKNRNNIINENNLNNLKEENNVYNKEEQQEQIIENNYTLNQPLIYNSNNTLSYSNNNINSKQNNFSDKENPIYNQNNINDKYNKSFQNKDQIQNNNAKENIDMNQNFKNFNRTSPLLEPNIAQIQTKYNIVQFSKIINKISYNQLMNKKYLLLNALKKIQYISKIGQIFFTIQTSVYRLQIKNFLKKLEIIKNSSINHYNNLENNYFNYPTKKYHYQLSNDENTVNKTNMNQKALFFYYHNLKKKIFRLLKFAFFCNNKKPNSFIFNKNINNSEENNTNNSNNNLDEKNNLDKYLNDDELLNSKVYNFFHGKEDNDFNDNQKYNTSINLNEKNDSNKSKDANDNANDNDNNISNKNDFNNDKNYEKVLQLRKILEDKDEDKYEKSLKNKNDIDIKDSKDINEPKNEVDELLNSLNNLYNEINRKCKSNNNSVKLTKGRINDKSGAFDKNKEYINNLKEIREKERERARKRANKNKKFDGNKLLGIPNFLKNTFSSLSKNI